MKALWRAYLLTFGDLPFVVLRVLVHLCASAFLLSRDMPRAALIPVLATFLVILLYRLHQDDPQE